MSLPYAAMHRMLSSPSPPLAPFSIALPLVPARDAPTLVPPHLRLVAPSQPRSTLLMATDPKPSLRGRMRKHFWLV
jgi:hypothetical protein